MSATPAAAAAPAPGRNVPVATAVAVGLAVLVLGSLYLWKPLFVGVAAVAAVVAVVELVGALAPTGVRVPVPPLVLGTIATVVAAYAGGAEGLVASFALTVVVTVGWRALEGADGFVRDVTAAAFVAAYVPLLVGFGTLMAAQADGAEQVVAVIVLVTCSDTGGFFAGSRFGRHKLAPTISPKKSWEGLAGSVVLASVVGVVLLPLLLDLAWWQALLTAWALVASATVGDLGESLVKRDLGIKDMSNLLPGHGGLLDRIDALLVSIPVAWMLFTLWL